MNKGITLRLHCLHLPYLLDMVFELSNKLGLLDYGVAPHWNVYPVKCGHPEVAESEWLRGEPRMNGWEGPRDGTQWMLRP